VRRKRAAPGRRREATDYWQIFPDGRAHSAARQARPSERPPNPHKWDRIAVCGFAIKNPKQPKVVFNQEHISRELTPIPKRPLSAEEMEWVRQSLEARKELLDFGVPQLFAISKCPCGTSNRCTDADCATGTVSEIHGDGIEKEQQGMQRNPYRPLMAPRFLLTTEKSALAFASFRT